jgi:hypothetical protein
VYVLPGVFTKVTVSVAKKGKTLQVFFFILQVYKTQLTRISESWDDKVADMEKVSHQIFLQCTLSC